MPLVIPYSNFEPGEDIESAPFDANFQAIKSFVNTLEADIAGKIGGTGGSVAGNVSFGGNYTVTNIRNAVTPVEPVSLGQFMFLLLSYLPIGVALPYLGDTAPNDNFLLPQGQTFSATVYPLLYALLGTNVLPDMRSRTTVCAGQGTGLTARTLNTKGGAENAPLNISELPQHTHTLIDPGHTHILTDPGHTHTLPLYYNISGGTLSPITMGLQHNGNYVYQGDASPGVSTRYTGVYLQTAYTGMTVEDVGSGLSHNNMQPYIVLNSIIRAK